MGNLIAQIIAGVLGGLTDTVGNIWGKVEGDQEHQYRKDIVNDRAALMDGRGGMSDWQKQQATSKLKGDLSAWQAQQLAKTMRGANTGAGESGMLAQQQGDVTRAAAANLRGGLSDIRGQDLALAEQRRQELIRRMEFAIAAENQRKTGTTLDTSSDLNTSGQAVGSAFRDYQGGKTDTATEGIAGDSGGASSAASSTTTSAPTTTSAGAAATGKSRAPGPTGSPLAGASSPLSTNSSSSSNSSSKSSSTGTSTTKTQAPKASWQQ